MPRTITDAVQEIEEANGIGEALAGIRSRQPAKRQTSDRYLQIGLGTDRVTLKRSMVR